MIDTKVYYIQEAASWQIEVSESVLVSTDDFVMYDMFTMVCDRTFKKLETELAIFETVIKADGKFVQRPYREIYVKDKQVMVHIVHYFRWFGSKIELEQKCKTLDIKWQD